MDELEGNYGSITIRVPFELIAELHRICGRQKGRKYPDKSTAIRTWIERGRQFESLLEIYNDPKRRVEFEDKLSGIAKVKDMEKYIATITDPQMLDAFSFIIQNQKNAHVRQLLLDLK